MTNATNVDGVDGSVDGAEGVPSTPECASDLRKRASVDGVDGESENLLLGAHVHAIAHTHAREGYIEKHRQHRQPSTPCPAPSQPSPLPAIKAGRCVVDGVEHVMRMAKPSSVTARLYGMNPNHHVRVWCECQDARRRVRISGGIDAIAAKVDQRDLEWDWLGFADLREPGSALDLFRRHIREVASL